MVIERRTRPRAAWTIRRWRLHETRRLAPSIDLGTAKELTYNAATHRSMLDQVWISQSFRSATSWENGSSPTECLPIVRAGPLPAHERVHDVGNPPTALDKVVLDLMTLETDLTRRRRCSQKPSSLHLSIVY